MTCLLGGIALLPIWRGIPEFNWVGAILLFTIALGVFIWSQRPQLHGLRLAAGILGGLSVGLLLSPILGGLGLLGGLVLGGVLGLILLSKR